MENRHIADEHKQLVREVCEEILSDPARANTVTLKELANHERIEGELCADLERPRRLGHLLTNVGWASKWSRGRYLIDLGQ